MTNRAPKQAHFNIQQSQTFTWNVEPLMHELRHAFSKLLEKGEETIIDLRSLPLAPGEEEHILDLLGQGEVSASLDALGESSIYETRYSGTWITTHCNENGDIVGRFIEVTRMPSILLAQQVDIREAHNRLASQLESEDFLSKHSYAEKSSAGEFPR